MTMAKERAIATTLDILEVEDFELLIKNVDKKMQADNDDCYYDLGQKVFMLKDVQGCNYGGIEQKCFDNLAGILDSLDMYHDDCIYPDEEGMGYPEFVSFVEDDKITEMLFNISVGEVEEFIKKFKPSATFGYITWREAYESKVG